MSVSTRSILTISPSLSSAQERSASAKLPPEQSSTHGPRLNVVSFPTRNAANPGDQVKSNDAMKLILIVPMGVELKIFPWSVHALSDYLKPCGLPLDVTIWDLRHDEQLSEIRQAFGPVQDEVFGVLTKKYRDVFDVNRTSLPFGVLASMGSSFLDAAAKHEQGRSRSALA
ncbi:MAG: hypothetical protein RIF41_26370, partial [Polyangiaceae bacterium]